MAKGIISKLYIDAHTKLIHILLKMVQDRSMAVRTSLRSGLIKTIEAAAIATSVPP
jgi:hypothetical protein